MSASKRRAKGTWEYGATPKISITFERKMFDRINDFAESSGCTFGAAVRRLVGRALAQIDRKAGGQSENGK